jgi:serine protease Do
MAKWFGSLFRTPAGMFLSIGMVIGALVTVAIISYRVVPVRAESGEAAANLTVAEQSTLHTIESAFAKIVDHASPAVVSIRVEKEVQSPSFWIGRGRLEGEGSGVVIDSNGWVLTNDHVVRGADEVTVQFSDGRKMEGKVRRDFLSDLAVLKVDAKNLPCLPIGNSDAVRPGQFAIAIGSPFGLENSVTIGHISALSRSQYVPDGFVQAGRFYPTLIQTDAAINPGNSGGPLINVDGELIGITSAIASEIGVSAGVGFAIPINFAHGVAQQLIDTGKVVRGYLGVVPVDLTPADTKRLGVESGALLDEVEQGSPADKAGLKKGDVVVSIGGTPIRTQMDLRTTMLHVAPDKKAEVVVVRDGRKKTLTVKVIANPHDPDSGEQLWAQAEPSGEDGFTKIVPTKLGAEVAAPSAEVRGRFDLPKDIKGVIVVNVEPGTIAASFDVRPGDVIERFNGEVVKSPSHLKDLVSKAKGKYALVLRRMVLGDLGTIYIEVPAPD